MMYNAHNIKYGNLGIAIVLGVLICVVLYNFYTMNIFDNGYDENKRRK